VEKRLRCHDFQKILNNERQVNTPVNIVLVSKNLKNRDEKEHK